ncbi:muramidase family protein [Phenylobacterium sp.]|mgnify:CR=1 FL=1|uniref:muramidase family protein n=1 Tax=Phenylobacterium sp. TaxID=1871053 RepID=UPI002FE42295
MTLSLQRTVLALLATSALSACATQTEPLRPNFPIQREDPAPPPPAAEPTPRVEDAPIAQAPPAAVEARPLDTLPPAQAARPRAEPTYRSVTTRSVTGRVVDADGRATTYEVQKGDSLIAIARKLDTTVAQLREDNGIEGSNIRPGQRLKGPTTSAKAYIVGSGDTLYAIARRFGVTATALAEENDLSLDSTIRTGQRLRLPEGFRDRGPIETTTRVAVEGAEAQPTPALRPAPPPERTAAPPPAAAEPAFRTVTTRSVTGRVVEVEGKPVTYEVRRGDNLTEIARKLDTTVEQLRKDNNIKGSNIQPGQNLKGPRSTARAYVADAGDTLDQIARRFSVTAAALRSENGLSRNATIRAGQRIRLPDGYRDRGPITSTSRVPVERPSTPAAETPPPVRTPPPEAAPVLPSRPQPYTPGDGV